MRTNPESRAIDDPMLADRVRGVRYSPQKYNQEEQVFSDKKKASLREEVRGKETPTKADQT